MENISECDMLSVLKEAEKSNDNKELFLFPGVIFLNLCLFVIFINFTTKNYWIRLLSKKNSVFQSLKIGFFSVKEDKMENINKNILSIADINSKIWNFSSFCSQLHDTIGYQK